jgi:hypothetical protein
MKKLSIFTLIFVLGLAFISCNKSDVDDTDALLKAKPTGLPGNTSDGGVVPIVIVGDNPGGNVTCAEVGEFDNCSERVDYGYFDTGFPEDLTVTSDGETLCFEADGSIMIGDKYYKVGAVIVKGGSAADVYIYDGGTLSDCGLTAPKNASGKPAGISNVTFCFIIECEEEPDLVIAFKGFYGNTWACTVGGPGDINFVAYYDFHKGLVGKVYMSAGTTPATGDTNKPVGDITVDDIDKDGRWEVIIQNTNTEMLYHTVYLFVGTLEDYNKLSYENFPYPITDPPGIHDITPTSTVVIDLPF